MIRNSVRGIILFIVMLLGACSDSNDSNSITNSEPLAPLLSSYELSSTTSIPSAFTFDPVDRNFYLGGIGDGSLVRVDAGGTESEIRSADFLVQIWGANVDAERRRLWICVRDPEGIDNQVWIYDLNTDERVGEFLLGALWPKGDCNDLVIDESGVAYVTDPINPNIYRLDPLTEEGTIYISDPRFIDALGLGVGLNGIRISEDGTRLITNTIIPAQLFAISLPEPDEVVSVELEGDPLTTPDGMEFLDGDYYLIAFDAVHRIRFNDEYTRATVSTQGGFDEVTSGTAAEGALYAVNSEAISNQTGEEIDLPFEFFTIDLNPFD